MDCESTVKMLSRTSSTVIDCHLAGSMLCKHGTVSEEHAKFPASDKVMRTWLTGQGRRKVKTMSLPCLPKSMGHDIGVRLLPYASHLVKDEDQSQWTLTA